MIIQTSKASFFPFHEKFMDFGSIFLVLFDHFPLLSKQVLFVPNFKQKLCQHFFSFEIVTQSFILILQGWGNARVELNWLSGQLFGVHFQHISIHQLLRCFKVLVRLEVLKILLILNKNLVSVWLSFWNHLQHSSQLLYFLRY